LIITIRVAVLEIYNLFVLIDSKVEIKSQFPT